MRIIERARRPLAGLGIEPISIVKLGGVPGTGHSAYLSYVVWRLGCAEEPVIVSPSP
jgi:hypothetical protein